LLAYTKIKTLSFEEALHVSSVSEIALTGGIEIREAISMTSEAQITYPLTLEASESVIISDVLSKKLVKSLSESVRIASSVSLRVRLNASLTVKPSDSLSYTIGKYLEASEVLSVSDSVIKMLVKSLSEDIRVSSSASITLR
jgi:hypothetical protein